MLAFKEIIEDNNDIQKVVELLKRLQESNQKSEVIILPIEDNKDFIKAQEKSMSNTWDNSEDEAWDNV
jgi:hypothetical protein